MDIANAPNVTVFRPIIERLRREGHEVIITAWDRGQAKELSLGAWPETVLVGSQGFRSAALAKATSIFERSALLAKAVRSKRPEIGLGHASNSQVVASRLLGIPSINMMDYEHHPANHLGFRLANLVFLPAAVQLRSVRKFGLSRRRWVPYPGLKEDIALSTFEPDPGFRRHLGLSESEIVAVVRPAAEGALYHRHQNSLCNSVVAHLAESGFTVLVSPRTTSQGMNFREIRGVRILTDAVSGPDLLYHADLVIGAGGSMTREAAVLGTPVFSIFQGKPAAVDEWLVNERRMTMLMSLADLPAPQRFRRSIPLAPKPEILDRFLNLLTGKAEELIQQ